MVDEALTWSEHGDLVTKKVNKGLNILKLLRQFMDLKVLITVYKPLYNHTFITVPKSVDVLAVHYVIHCSVCKIELPE